ncbi:type I secretion system permease/ATPase [Maricaulis sp. MIT060901]|uniref:type I secretion system permease/ATPase n=1 Tax=Maricaulis sp. MIT060901 TaxID=3096993 RepID=UPI00399BBC34
MIKGVSLELRNRLKPHLRLLAGFGFAANILLLVSPLYMLQIYDRVLNSGSVDTLMWLSALAVFLLAIYGAAEMGRRRVSALAAKEIDAYFSPKIFQRFENQLEGRPDLALNLSRLSKAQTYVQQGSLLPFLDLPFAPLFLIVLFLIHPFIGMLGLIGAALVFGVAFLAEMSSRQGSQASQATLGKAGQFAADLERQRSALVSMGLLGRAYQRWQQVRDLGQGLALGASREDGKFTAISRALRQTLQILVLGGGAALALSQQISPGSIVASSIILARVLGPIDQIVGGWRNSVQTWTGWLEMSEIAEAQEERAEYTPLPRPAAELVLDRTAIGVPGGETPLLQAFNFTAGSADIIALTGGIGTGKTSFLQTVAGAWPTYEGSISLGGRKLQDWPSEDRGRYIGYIPQDVQLLPATIAENISRLGPCDDEAVLNAAKAAGAHEMILGLPDGYDTPVGPGGVNLSAGQKQLVGLARALFGAPVLLVLDEPTANLDSASASNLIKSVKAIAEAGAVVIISTHDRRVIEQSTTVLLLRNGAVLAAPADQYLKLAVGPGNAGPGGGQAGGQGVA